jgi:hypothetical protein
MTKTDLSFYGLKELPRFGKDHLALADWRLGVPHQRNAVHAGKILAYVEHRFEHASGEKFVSLEGGSQVGLPTDHDDLFLIALLTLAAALDFPQKVHFEPSHLLHVLRMPLKDRHYRRQRAAFDRLVKLNATFEGAWFDRKGTVPNGISLPAFLVRFTTSPSRAGDRKGSSLPAMPYSPTTFTRVSSTET